MGKKLVFTGGHHNSALVVAKELKEQGWEIIWFGHRHSMWADSHDSAEYQEITAAGIKFYDLQAGKFYHTYHPMKLLRIPWGFLQAGYWLIKERPAGIVSFGGYLAVPTVIMGWMMGIKSITHEQTVVTGWANELLGHFVSKVAVTWPNSLKYYPKNKAVLVGLPIRPEIIALRIVTKSHRPIIYITGGKQGSHMLNAIVFASLEDLLQKYTVIHQTGFADLAKAQKFRQQYYEYFDFDSSRAIAALKSAEIIIGRAGAHTIYELGLLGKRAVLIPLPNVSHHEQDINARILADAGNAVILVQDKLTKENLLEAITEVAKLRPKALPLPVDASTKMVKLVESVFA